MTDTPTQITADAEDSCPTWCEGCDDDARHVTDFEGVHPVPDADALARLVQNGDAAPEIELGVNDLDGGTAAIYLPLEQARQLADLLNDLIEAAELG